jgi:hypothetical protein
VQEPLNPAGGSRPDGVGRAVTEITRAACATVPQMSDFTSRWPIARVGCEGREAAGEASQLRFRRAPGVIEDSRWPSGRVPGPFST